MTFIPFILDQHAEEVALLWLRRDRSVTEPHYRLADLAKLDGRLDANLDGLRIADATAAGAASSVCEHEMRWEEPGEVFPAAVLALEQHDEHRIQAILRLANTSYQLSRPVISALAWLTWQQAAGFVDRFLHAAEPALRRIAIASSVAHRQDPGQWLDRAIDDADEVLRARALWAVGELGRLDLITAVREHIGDENSNCALAASWSAALLEGDASALDILQRAIPNLKSDNRLILQVTLCRAELQQAKMWIGQLANYPNTTRFTIIAAGLLAVPDVLPWLIEQMQSPPFARVAGEAFAMITGVDIAFQDLDGDWPAGFRAGPTEDPDDENVEMDPDENLPWPDPAKIRDWWQKHRHEFVEGTRYLVGKPITIEWLEDILRNGFQRQRAAAALELAIRRPGQPLFEVRAPGFRQQQILGVK